jgi:hypothetical protein
MYIKNIFPAVVLLSCLVCGQTNINPATGNPIRISNWKKIDRDNYSLRYPANWDLQQSENTEAGVNVSYLFAILSPLESKQDKFRENINLVIEDLNGQKIDLDGYARLSKVQIESNFQNAKVIEQKKIDNGSRKHYKVIFTWDYEIFHLKVEQYYWVVNGKAYVLTFTSEETKFSKFRGTGEKILNTFILKTKSPQ